MSKLQGHSYGVTWSLGIAVLSRGHSYGVTWSLGIAVLSRGHSYGVAGSTGHRGAIERKLLRRADSITLRGARCLHRRCHSKRNPRISDRSSVFYPAPG